jgi:hypothetical protein
VNTRTICIAASLLASLLSAFHAQALTLRVEASALSEARDGRLLVAFSRKQEGEPRRQIGWPVARTMATQVFAMDVKSWTGNSVELKPSAGYPVDTLEQLAPGQWYVQALFDQNTVLPDINAPGNLYSAVEPLLVSPSINASLTLDLAKAEPAETLPRDKDYIRYVKIRSELLSQFYGEDIHLRAAVLLPHQYVQGAAKASAARFPVLFNIGGLNSRYTRAERLWNDDDFRGYWTGDDAAPVVMVFLDGLSPWGDSYQVNSAISGPYADANFKELFPYLAANFPIRNQNDARFLHGCSTGGWVSLALQVFYPEYFAGSWPFSPDSPSFGAFQIIDLYEDDNAFVNEFGMQRPSMRTTDGEPMFGVGDEIALERVLGAGDNWLYSGQQWASWNAVYGQPDEDGAPIPAWDDNGTIDTDAVASWKSWDIERYLAANWNAISAALNGKLHITMGDMDNFYLNVGLRRLEASMAELSDPPASADFEWIPERGHCAFDIQRYYIDVLEAIGDTSVR